MPTPQLTGRAALDSFEGGRLIHYIHYSLSMNRARRVAAFTAHNIDAARAVRGIGREGVPWQLDERVGEYQLGPSTYSNNAWDRGHLVRREDVLWGTPREARAANRASFFYTNAAPQHENFNQDEWLALENWVLHRAPDFSYRLCVLTGPVLSDDDRLLSEGDPELRRLFRDVGDDVRIPAAFWKVVALRDASAGGDDLAVVAFAMRQTDLWNDKNGKRMLKLKVYQTTLSVIADWTGLDFGDLAGVDELEWSEDERRRRRLAEQPGVELVPWPEIHGPDDIVWSGPERRALGNRSRRGAAAGGTRRIEEGQPAPDSPCGCAASEFDARKAVAALAKRIEVLADAIAEPTVPAGLDRQAGGPRRVFGPARDPAPAGVSAGQWAAMQAALDSTAGAAQPTRIVGGGRALADEFPSCVCLGDATQWFCSGVLVHPRVVLTAAHCGGAISRAMVGGLALEPVPDGRIATVRRVFVHPQYRPRNKQRNDIHDRAAGC